MPRATPPVERVFQSIWIICRCNRTFTGKSRRNTGAFQNRARYCISKVNQAETDRYVETFSEQSEAIKDLAYTQNKYSIVIPTKPEELAEEGINLSHCVRTVYRPIVANGEVPYPVPAVPRYSGAVARHSAIKRQANLRGSRYEPTSLTTQEAVFSSSGGREKEIEIAV